MVKTRFFEANPALVGRGFFFISGMVIGQDRPYHHPNHRFGSWGSTASLSAAQSGDAVAIARDFLEERRQELGLQVDDLAEVTTADAFASDDLGITHVHLAQRYQGIELLNLRTSVHVAADGRVVAANSNFMADLATRVGGSVGLGEIEAAQRAAEQLGFTFREPLVVVSGGLGLERKGKLSLGGVLAREASVRLVYVPVGPERLRLAWHLEMDLADGSHFWNVAVDAVSGRLIYKTDYTVHDQFGEADVCAEENSKAVPPSKVRKATASKAASSKRNPDSYEVFEMPSEYPPDGPRTIVTNPAHAQASPFGWHDTNGAAGAEHTITRGNNVNAYADRNDDNLPDSGSQPNAGASLDFTGALVPLDLNTNPDTYIHASVTNLFYWNNIIHDLFALNGLTEAAGSFRETNYSGQGLGNDYVLAEAQDGASNGNRNNANFATPPDGQSGRMQMFLWDTSNPERDGDFSNDIIVHEYGHGISNRGTGGPSNASCLFNEEQMGEGWSDWFAIVMTAKAEDEGPTPRGMGTWALNQPPDGAGIRPARYSTDMAVNDYTYENVGSMAVPHGVGFIWATMLWEVYWALVEEHGFNPNFYDDWTTGGNNLALRLVMEGILLQPCSPGFVDGRDAILLADQNLTGGANRCLIWEAFAKRGLGFSASQGSSSSVNDGVAAFDLPSTCLLLSVAESVSVCAPDDALYGVAVGAGMQHPVTLSAENVPEGLTVNFGPILTVPGATRATVSGTGNLEPGTYSFAITAQDGVTTSSQTVSLTISDGLPNPPSLLSPTLGQADTSRRPLLTWEEGQGCSSMADFQGKLPDFGEQESVLDLIACLELVLDQPTLQRRSASSTYLVELDEDPSFASPLITATTTEPSYQVTQPLMGLTTYYWRVQGENTCGGGSYSQTGSFVTVALPAILLVDDDSDNPNVRGYYTGALDALGLDYDVWETGASNLEPTANDLSVYPKVIWFSGVRYGGNTAGPSSASETALADFLDDGGCFLLSSQDYFYDRGLSSLMTDYLGVTAVDNDRATASCTGLAGSLFEGMGPYTLSPLFTDYADVLTPGNGGVGALVGDRGIAGTQKVTGTYTAVYSTIPLEKLPAQALQDALAAFLTACD